MRQHGEGPKTITRECQVASDEISKGPTRQAHQGPDGAARAAPGGAPALPGGPQGGEAALPCLNSGNSIQPPSEPSELPPEKQVENAFHLSPYTRKTVFALVENIQTMADKFGIERLGFLTLTFAENLQTWDEASKRFNSLNSNVLSQLFKVWVLVAEPQARGAVHYHLLVVCAEDIRSGFDFEAVKQGDYSSASPYLKQLWKLLRQAMPKYQFGRSELIPVRSNKEAIACYLGKYMAKERQATESRNKVKKVLHDAMKRGSAPVEVVRKWEWENIPKMRRLRYSRKIPWRSVSTAFAWVSPGATKWRSAIKALAQIAGCDSLEELRERFGPRWAYHLRDIIDTYAKEGEEAGKKAYFELMLRQRMFRK